MTVWGPHRSTTKPLAQRRLRRLGGKDATQEEREPALIKMRGTLGPLLNFGGRHQCYCGSTEGKQYRGAWWCPQCGREKRIPYRGRGQH